MRYIIFKDFGGKDAPFIFPDRVEFVDMREQMPYATVVACGDVHLVDGVFVCNGGDKELGVTARPEDVGLISEAFTAAS